MTLPFDEIYCLHLTENVERYNLMMSEYDRIGIRDQVKIWWTVKRKISIKIGNLLESLHSSYYNIVKSEQNKNIYGSVFNCSFEHYTIIKQAYLRGLNTILILEDDIKFIDNIDFVKKAFTQLPEQWDVIKFHNGFNGRQEYLQKYNGEDDLWNLIKTDYKAETSTACYALNKNAMKFYIDAMDRYFTYADAIFPMFIDNDFKYYDTNYLVVYNDMEQNSDIVQNTKKESN